MEFKVVKDVLVDYDGMDSEVVVPNGVTAIKSHAFSNCKCITNVMLPSSLRKIGEFAFSGCTNLKTITFSGPIIEIGYDCFSDCSNLERIELPEGIEQLSYGTFLKCVSLKHVILPSTLNQIEDYAFSDCEKLISIEMKARKVNIVRNAFEGCTSLKIDSECIIFGDTIYGYNGSGNLKIPNYISKIAEEAFLNCQNLTSVEIPNSIKIIPHRAFMNCENLKRVLLNDGLEQIDEIAFCGCSSLTDINIPDSVKSIGVSAFSCCTNLERVQLPNALSEISSDMFGGCRGLKHIDIPNSVTYIGMNALSATGFDTFDFSNTEVTNIGLSAFSNSNIEKIILSDKIKILHYGLFFGCKNLKELYIPESIIECEKELDDSDISIIHMSAKLVSGFGTANKYNAVKTYLDTKENYSVSAIKDWDTYIKRQKENLIKRSIRINDIDTGRKIIEMCSISDSLKDELIDCAMKVNNGDFVELLTAKVSDRSKTVKKEMVSKEEVDLVDQLISLTPLSSSQLRKTQLLETLTLIGSTSDLERIYDKYGQFEYTKQAIVEAVCLGDIEKLKLIIKQGLDYKRAPSFKAKYGNMSNTPIAELLTKVNLEEMIDFDRIRKFVASTLKKTYELPEINILRNTHSVDAFETIAQSSNAVTMSEFLHNAFLNENYILAESIIRKGHHITEDYDMGYNLSRRIAALDPKVAIIMLKEYANVSSNATQKLDDKNLYDVNTSFCDDEVFAIICSQYDISRFTKKNLVKFILDLDDAGKLKTALGTHVINDQKGSLLDIYNKSTKSSKCHKYIKEVFITKYGDIESFNRQNAEMKAGTISSIKALWTYSVIDGNIVIRGYKGNETIVTVPSEIAGKPVLAFDVSTFSPFAPRLTESVREGRKNVQTVILPKHLNEITDDNLEYMNGDKMGQYFYIPEDSDSYSESFLMEMLNETETLLGIENCGNYVVQDGMVFDSMKTKLLGICQKNIVQELSIPSSVEYIAYAAFKDCGSLTELHINSDVKAMDLRGNDVRFLHFPVNLTVLYIEGLKTIEERAFSECENLREIHILGGVEEIKNGAFRVNKKLEKLIILNDTVTFESGTFPIKYREYKNGSFHEKHVIDSFVVFCHKGSTAEAAAKIEGAAIEYID